MKIDYIFGQIIEFDNGNKITIEHHADCSERNYADLTYLDDDEVLDYDFDEEIIIEEVLDSGFRFGDKRRMFFVPCYSEQNGYYSSNIDVFYCKRTNVECEKILY